MEPRQVAACPEAFSFLQALGIDEDHLLGGLQEPASWAGFFVPMPRLLKVQRAFAPDRGAHLIGLDLSLQAQ
jgi:hypothetical protein